ncbi:unnamed protein product, partial [Natator depressus]
ENCFAGFLHCPYSKCNRETGRKSESLGEGSGLVFWAISTSGQLLRTSVIFGSGIQLTPGEPEAEADAEEDDSVNEVTIENIRPRPQGSSPVYEYSIEEEYFNKK